MIEPKMTNRHDNAMKTNEQDIQSPNRCLVYKLYLGGLAFNILGLGIIVR